MSDNQEPGFWDHVIAYAAFFMVGCLISFFVEHEQRLDALEQMNLPVQKGTK